MNRFYFTFGSDPEFPYGRKDIVVVTAKDENMACDLFQAVHPNRPGSSCINCASIYAEDEFNEFRDKYYKGIEPVETIEVTVNEK